MKNTYKLNGLDCANCAVKIEDALKKIDGVNSVKVNFITTKLTMEFDDSKEKEISASINKVTKKVDSAIKVEKIR